MPQEPCRQTFEFPVEVSSTDTLARYFRAFGDPTRLRILELLATAERSAGDLVALTGEPPPEVSHHLACLRWCGLVADRRENRRVYYSIADPRVGEVVRLARELLADNAEHVDTCMVLERSAY